MSIEAQVQEGSNFLIMQISGLLGVIIFGIKQLLPLLQKPEKNGLNIDDYHKDLIISNDEEIRTLKNLSYENQQKIQIFERDFGEFRRELGEVRADVLRDREDLIFMKAQMKSQSEDIREMKGLLERLITIVPKRQADF